MTDDTLTITVTTMPAAMRSCIVPGCTGDAAHYVVVEGGDRRSTCDAHLGSTMSNAVKRHRLTV